MREKLLEQYPDETFFLVDGFDDAIVGVVSDPFRVVYDVNKCIEILERQGLPPSNAIDYFYFNVAGSYMGEATPLFMEPLDTTD